MVEFAKGLRVTVTPVTDSGELGFLGQCLSSSEMGHFALSLTKPTYISDLNTKAVNSPEPIREKLAAVVMCYVQAFETFLQLLQCFACLSILSLLL